MHFGLISDYWWAIPIAMGVIVLTYVTVTGRRIEGGLTARARHGWREWRALSRRVGEFQARVILTAVYFTVAAPFGLSRTLFTDALRLKRSNQTRAWLPRQTRDLTLEDGRRQY